LGSSRGRTHLCSLEHSITEGEAVAAVPGKWNTFEEVSTQYEPWPSSPAARAVMRANRRRDTTPEVAVRRAVHGLGMRYRVDARPLPDLNRRADLVFSKAKVAVFVD